MDTNCPEYSLCDIYYHEETKTLRNHKEEVLAFFHEGSWHEKLDKVKKTYSPDFIEAISQALKDHAQESGEEIVLILKREFSEIKQQKIEEDELLKDAAIALDLNPKDLTKLQNKLMQIFSDLELEAQKINNPHVSTAYLMGYNRYSELAETLKTLANFSYEFKVSGFEILKGATTNRDYFVLKLNPPQNFFKALEQIEKNKETIKFPGGFKTHISLFSFEKNSLTPEKEKSLQELLKNKRLKINHQISIKPQSVSLFNNSRLLELRQRLKSAITPRN